MKLNWIDSYYGLIVPVIMSPFGIFYLRQSFFQIPIELDEAALIDGAGYLGILFRIIVPNSLAALGNGGFKVYVGVGRFSFTVIDRY